MNNIKQTIAVSVISGLIVFAITSYLKRPSKPPHDLNSMA